MKIRRIALMLCLLFLPCLSLGEEIVIPEYQTAEYTIPFARTLDALDDLKVPCDQQGTLQSITYTAPAYAVNEILDKSESLEKTLQVYLPYGYDESKPYDILYLLHGTGGNDKYWFYNAEPETTRNVLDNMIRKSLCPPVIVVTPCYITEIKGKDNKIKDDKVAAYAEKMQDSYLKVRNDLWTEFFRYELRNDIIPLVESRFSTYARGDVSEESLAASRTHRGIAGLSRGSMATMRAGLVENRDLFAWFGNFSGIWLDFGRLQASLQGDAYPISYWYNGTGTQDFAAENHLLFHNEVLKNLSGSVRDGENYCMIVKDGGAHDYPSWITDLYNALLVFFK